MSLPPSSGVEVSLDRLVALAAIAGLSETTGFARSNTGGRSGRRRGEGGDIFDLRPFQEGDDPRRIDPAASARSGRTQVRSRHEEVEQTVLLVADFRRTMLWGTRRRLRSVAAAEALALEGWQVVAAGGRVGCHVACDGSKETLAPRPRDAAMLAVAGTFARMHAAAMADPACKSVPLSAILENVTAQVRPGVSVVVATGFDDPGADIENVASALMRKCQLAVLLVQDAVDVAPPTDVFSMRIADRVTRARFGAPSSEARLKALGIKTRIVQAAPLNEEIAT